ncbi:hypothetical protein [Umezawaea beigongshangensis]|uniref:hypothetical protein n=1 Tax=Umezawaea beigongshangensis TaxID=2780383 RepID=UPI0018F158D1|nr:hypothetical protein [Umezawaea beigongshangensis]
MQFKNKAAEIAFHADARHLRQQINDYRDMGEHSTAEQLVKESKRRGRGADGYPLDYTGPKDLTDPRRR